MNARTAFFALAGLALLVLAGACAVSLLRVTDTATGALQPATPVPSPTATIVITPKQLNLVNRTEYAEQDFTVQVKDQAACGPLGQFTCAELLVATGTCVAVIDNDKYPPEIHPDGKRVDIRVGPPELLPCRTKDEQFYQVGGAFNAPTELINSLRGRAVRLIDQSGHNSNLLDGAQDHAYRALTDLARKFGAEQVVIRFDAPPTGTPEPDDAQ
jgi:hypothetical protein